MSVSEMDARQEARTDRAERVRRDRPLQLALDDVQLVSDRGQRDEDRGRVRHLVSCQRGQHGCESTRAGAEVRTFSSSAKVTVPIRTMSLSRVRFRGGLF